MNSILEFLGAYGMPNCFLLTLSSCSETFKIERIEKMTFVRRENNRINIFDLSKRYKSLLMMGRMAIEDYDVPRFFWTIVLERWMSSKTIISLVKKYSMVFFAWIITAAGIDAETSTCMVLMTVKESQFPSMSTYIS